MADMDYMDPMSSVPKKADKLNLSLSLNQGWSGKSLYYACHNDKFRTLVKLTALQPIT